MRKLQRMATARGAAELILKRQAAHPLSLDDYLRSMYGVNPRLSISDEDSEATMVTDFMDALSRPDSYGKQITLQGDKRYGQSESMRAMIGSFATDSFVPAQFSVYETGKESHHLHWYGHIALALRPLETAKDESGQEYDRVGNLISVPFLKTMVYEDPSRGRLGFTHMNSEFFSANFEAQHYGREVEEAQDRQRQEDITFFPTFGD